MHWYKITAIVIFSSLILFTVSCLDNVDMLPEEVENMVGTYLGEWTIYGLDGDGNTIPFTTWTDSAVAGNPTAEDGRAYVSVIDYMTFQPPIPPQTVEWIEGYTVNDYGNAEDRFMEMNDRVTILYQVGESTWAYSTAADTNELVTFGFTHIVSGQHDFIKVERFTEGVETHYVSRTTTVEWRDEGGQIQTTQWMSMQGFHRRSG